MRRFLSITLLSLFVFAAYAQEQEEKTVDIWVKILDYYYEEPVQDGLKAEILNADSTLLSELMVANGEDKEKPTTFAMGSLPARDGNYIVRLSHPRI